ncbi:baseplate protein [Paenibacillus psychroresistens]|uniref:Baseplate protein n=1 Tax=Paenibacillus psychroresistens TaxID=1778678 RepID=A0A6B8RJM1_9BACL|nr:GPW/gp25 family protein [Paenibacillus psychroresistens]QGQ96641.1 baseplate protein [Paenibacillus psychroresistens]
MGNAFLGRGWKFPIQVDETTGRIMTSEFEEDIAESIRIIIGTTKGERVMRPNFGSGIQKFLFGLTDSTTINLLKSEVKESIREWEARVGDIEVEAELDRSQSGKLLVTVSYIVRSTNNMHNLVFPFYINEGSKN